MSKMVAICATHSIKGFYRRLAADVPIALYSVQNKGAKIRKSSNTLGGWSRALGEVQNSAGLTLVFAVFLVGTSLLVPLPRWTQKQVG